MDYANTKAIKETLKTLIECVMEIDRDNRQASGRSDKELSEIEIDRSEIRRFTLRQLHMSLEELT